MLVRIQTQIGAPGELRRSSGGAMLWKCSPELYGCAVRTVRSLRYKGAQAKPWLWMTEREALQILCSDSSVSLKISWKLYGFLSVLAPATWTHDLFTFSTRVPGARNSKGNARTPWIRLAPVTFVRICWHFETSSCWNYQGKLGGACCWLLSEKLRGSHCIRVVEKACHTYKSPV